MTDTIVDKAIADKHLMKYIVGQKVWIKCKNNKACPVFILSINENGTYDIGQIDYMEIAKNVQETELHATEEEGSFIYKYPAEALFIRRIFLPQAPHQALPFKERFCSDFNCRTLRVAVRTAHAEYTRRITDENLFDAAFIKSFHLALAGDLALALLGNPELAFRLIQEYTLSLGEVIEAWNRRAGEE